MKPSHSIQSITEARMMISEVMQRLTAVEEYFIKCERIFRGPGISVATPPVASANGHSSMPSTFIDRMEAILAGATKPMRPKTATREYENRGWPLPGKGGNLYNNVAGALLYLYKTKKTVDRNDDGYFLKGSQVAREQT
jgi:hypothetical protein